MDNAKVKLEETDNRHRLHIGSYFVDLNENQYQELIKIFSKQNSPVLDNNKQKESEKWQKIYSKIN